MNIDNLKEIYHKGQQLDKLMFGGGILWQRSLEYERYSSVDVSVPVEENIEETIIRFQFSGSVPELNTWHKHTDGYEYLVNERSTSIMAKYIVSYKRRYYKNVKQKGTYETTIWGSEGEYPTDGLHTDGYWYVLIK